MPLLPPAGSLNSSMISKSPYSFSLDSQPPPWPVVYRTSPSTPQLSAGPPIGFQPERSLPLNNGLNSGSAVQANETLNRTRVQASRRDME